MAVGKGRVAAAAGHTQISMAIYSVVDVDTLQTRKKNLMFV